jgi:hypothetical protein
MKPVETKKVYVDENNKAAFICPHCGTVKHLNVEKFKGRNRPFKVLCKCQSAFHVFLEFRSKYRKKTSLFGSYVKLPMCNNEWGKMQVRDISMSGMWFATLLIKHNLSIGDEVKVKFILDDGKRAEMEKTAIVRWVRDENVGCEFTSLSPYEKDLWYYLMP